MSIWSTTSMASILRHYMRITRETEASATQTKQTASHLNGLSTELLQLVGTETGRRP